MKRQIAQILNRKIVADAYSGEARSNPMFCWVQFRSVTQPERRIGRVLKSKVLGRRRVTLIVRLLRFHEQHSHQHKTTNMNEHEYKSVWTKIDMNLIRQSSTKHLL